ncbi:MAG TPA: hypothetical protein VEI53_00060, partial [Ktedonobacteraceae bacterium]|nr:hypothetical protein [Ktedonobacteraceae bacterium]
LLGGRKKSVGVPFAVDVETDELAVVVDAVDSGTIITDTAESLPVVDALGVVDCLPLHVKQRTGQQETTRLVIAVHIGTNDLVILVDTQEHRAGRRRAGRDRVSECCEGIPFQQEPVGVVITVDVEASDVAVVVDRRCGQTARPGRKGDCGEFATFFVEVEHEAVGNSRDSPISVDIAIIEANRDALIVEAKQLSE